MGTANPSADRAFASGLSKGPERGSVDMQITQPRTAALRQALAAVRNEAAMQDLLYLEAWEMAPEPGSGPALRVVQIRRANPELAAAIRAELASRGSTND